jgi:hypothetical protein
MANGNGNAEQGQGAQPVESGEGRSWLKVADPRNAADRVENVKVLGQVAQGENSLRFTGAAVVIGGNPWNDGGHGV